MKDALKQLAQEFAKFNKKGRIASSPVEDIPYVEITDAVHDQREARLQNWSS